MPTSAQSFDLVLSYPQWQGSGRPKHLKRGADAVANVARRYGSVHIVDDSGPGIAVGGVNGWTAILSQFKAAQRILAEHHPKRLLTAGGDCACDVVVIDYLLQLYPDLTVIWVDAHLDANTVETSPSGNFHGMPVATLLGAAPKELKPFLGAPLRPSQFRYVSASVGDEGDWLFQKTNGLAWLTDDELITGPVHIHFDLDALNPAEFPYLAYPEGNLSRTGGLALVQRICATAKVVGLTITEFAPGDSQAAATGSLYVDQLCRVALGISQDASDSESIGE